MNQYILLTTLVLCTPWGFALAENTTTNKLLEDYTRQGATSPDAQQGKILWQQKFSSKGEYNERSCATCHTKDLTKPGKHIKTNKAIKPMAPSVNPQRLTNSKKVNKWFKRNCKWTMGRECTAQEKANILTYIDNQSIK